MTDDDIHQRLDRLESLVTEQNDKIEQQQKTIEAQQETIEQLRAEQIREKSQSSESTPTVTRRDALTAGGVLGLFGLGMGTASADPQGTIGSGTDEVNTLYVDTLDGNLTGDTSVTSVTGNGLEIASSALQLDLDAIAGSNLSVNGSQLDASGGGGGVTAKEISSNYTTSGEDAIFLDTSSSSFTLTLSDADQTAGNVIHVRDIAGNASSNTVTITQESGSFPNGTFGSSFQTNSDYQNFIFISDGSTWHVANVYEV